VTVAALGTAQLADRAAKQGRTFWSDTRLDAQEAQLAVLTLTQPDEKATQELADAVAAQQSLRAVSQATKEIKRCLATPTSAASTPTQRACAALEFVLASFADVAAMYYDPDRIACLHEARRRRDRLISVVANKSTAFIGGGGGNSGNGPAPSRAHGAAPPPPVLVVGNWALARGSSQYGFAFKTFLRHLAQTCIVIVANEFNTSKLCSCCGSDVVHPSKQAGAYVADRGSVYCVNNECPSQQRLANRDVCGGASILNRFYYSVFFGGHLGMHSGNAVLLVFFGVFFLDFLFVVRSPTRPPLPATTPWLACACHMSPAAHRRRVVPFKVGFQSWTRRAATPMARRP
jgi:hypothetical protein